MATLEITRTNEYSYRMRNYIIFLDNEKIGSIANGQTKEIEVEFGRHTLYASLDRIILSPEISFEITGHERKIFQIGSAKYGTVKHPTWIGPVATGALISLCIIKFVFAVNMEF